MNQGFTKLYNFIWQEYLPLITGAQLKILIIILVQTVGWNKERDWISHEQYMDKTGLSRSAVTRSLCVLEQKKMIIITDKEGRELTSGQRKFQSRLYYQISTEAVSNAHVKGKMTYHQRYKVPSTRDTHKRHVEAKNETKKHPIRKLTDRERILEILGQSQYSRDKRS